MLFQRTWIGPTTCFALSIVLAASAALYYRATHSQDTDKSSRSAAKSIDESESSIDTSISVEGQTLPSAYYLTDDVNYHPTGPEFKLWREAEALKHTRMENEKASEQIKELQSRLSDPRSLRPWTYQRRMMILFLLYQFEPPATNSVSLNASFVIPRIIIQEEEEKLQVGDIGQ